ncbi:metallophosphoesterase family protein [Chitinimonas koreensis]|uniref:metallophosphoesterase family protein n=1 Tax=Chitinimonas koreensis TaxID=356302 RepID=UPI0003FD52F0|nr:metallophosphoesterase family protein [Chitinimonas koreensis]QNM95624.1 metallophosphoesterase family protein [Chitinimonas koreensis]
MRLALVSDIHGNLPALEAVLADLARRAVDRIANLGDSLSGPLWPAETAALLMRQDWPQLAGNHERQLLAPDRARMNASDGHARDRLGDETLAWIAALPATLALDDDVLLCHGTPDSDLVYFLETVTPQGSRMASRAEVDARLGDVEAGLVACGHTHLPRTMRAGRGTLVVNPGSVGLPAYDDDHPYFHLSETGSPDARYAIVERTDAGWRAELIALPYDHEAAAQQAERNGRPDWAHALRTGYALLPSPAGGARA